MGISEIRSRVPPCERHFIEFLRLVVRNESNVTLSFTTSYLDKKQRKSVYTMLAEIDTSTISTFALDHRRCARRRIQLIRVRS